MKRPSRRTVIVAGGSFVAGLLVAFAVTTGFALFVLSMARGAAQSQIIAGLSTNTLLLQTADKHPDALVAHIASNAQLNSQLAAGGFDEFDKSHQETILEFFKLLNHSPILRANKSPIANSTFLARTMVLCTHRSATPEFTTYAKDDATRVDIPAWVLDPSATPPTTAPEIQAQWYSKPRSVVAKAVLAHWITLHDWVKANQPCIARQGGVP